MNHGDNNSNNHRGCTKYIWGYFFGIVQHGSRPSWVAGRTPNFVKSPVTGALGMRFTSKYPLKWLGWLGSLPICANAEVKFQCWKLCATWGHPHVLPPHVQDDPKSREDDPVAADGDRTWPTPLLRTPLSQGLEPRGDRQYRVGKGGAPQGSPLLAFHCQQRIQDRWPWAMLESHLMFLGFIQVVSVVWKPFPTVKLERSWWSSQLQATMAAVVTA